MQASATGDTLNPRCPVVRRSIRRRALALAATGSRMVCGITEGRHPVPIEKTNSFDIIVEEVVATVNFGLEGNITACEDAFTKIGGYAKQYARVGKTLRFAFPYADTTMRVAVTLDEPA